jgi:hypothetical protein
MPLTRFDRLISELAKGQVTVLVGTGVSVYSTGNAPSASWKGLLMEVSTIAGSGRTQGPQMRRSLSNEKSW